MIRSIRFLTLILLAAASQVFAQAPKRVAFVEAARDRIFITNGTKTDTLFAPMTAPVEFAAQRLTVLGSTKDGKNLLVAGKFRYFNPSFLRYDSIIGFFRVAYPLTLTNLDLIAIAGGTSEKVKQLRKVNENPQKILPLGIIADNDNDWYGVWCSAQPGRPTVVFYHGHMNGGTVDTIAMGPYPGDPDGPQSGYHMSNLAVNANGDKVYCVMVDKLLNGATPEQRWRYVRWTPGIQTQTALQKTEFTVTGLRPNTVNTDSLFGFAFRVDPSSGTAQLAFTPDPDNSIKVITFPSETAKPSISPNNVLMTIDRSVIPENTNFFTGYTGSNGIGADVDPQAGQQGNGGDIMFSRDGNSLVFITHSADDDVNLRPSRSGVWVYTGGSATELFNDPTKEERQPVFIDDGPPPIPPKHGMISLSQSTLDFGKIDTMSTKSLTINITNTSDTTVLVKSVAISGPDAASWSVDMPAPLPYDLGPGLSKTYTVTFNAGPIADTMGAMLNFIITSDSNDGGTNGIDTTANVTLRGMSKVKSQQGSVLMSRNAQFNVTISPNPAREMTELQITSTVAGRGAYEVRDILGRVVFQSGPISVSTGETSLTLDTRKLSAGVYYLQMSVEGSSIERQLVVQR